MAARPESKYAYGTAGNDLRMLEDTLSPATRGFYGGTDSDVQDMLDALNLGNYQNYGQPEEVFPGGPERDPNMGDQRVDLSRRLASLEPTEPFGPEDADLAQQFIRQQLAGDVVPMRPLGSTADVAATARRLETPGFYPGSRGAGSINTFGGQQSPYLDLLDILMYPSGRPAGR